MHKKLYAVIAALVLTFPFAAFAFPFGGQIGTIIFCHNNAIYAAVGPPRGGPFIWTPETKTYQFGPPTHSGQWLLGLAAPPYYCLVSRSPIIVWSGILMTMMGSSGRAAPPYNPPVTPPTPPTPAPGPNKLPEGTTPVLPATPTMGKLAITEVFYNVDSAHGSYPLYQWVELYNGSTSTVDLTGWTIRDSSSTTTLPGNFRIGPNTFALILASDDIRSKWQLPTNVQIMTLGAAIGNGLSTTSDSLRLRDRDGRLIDAISWGGDSTIFAPGAPVVSPGHSMARRTFERDTRSVADWMDLVPPSPGR